MKIVQLFYINNINKALYYLCNEDVAKGDLVFAKILQKKSLAIVFDVIEEDEISIQGKIFNKNNLKNIESIAYKGILKVETIYFIKKMSHYNIIPISKILECFFNKNFYSKILKNNNIAIQSQLITETKVNYQNQILNSEQSDVYQNIISSIQNFTVHVIKGVTGSGKTNVFLQIVNKILLEDIAAQILIMLPEISLTDQTLKSIKKICNIEPVVWHSCAAGKYKNLLNIISGNAKVIIGPRSALLLPYKNLKMIIVDEEHDQSYKQNESPIYHARDMAVLRAKCENIPIILSSATISIETLNNIIQKKYNLHLLHSRYFNVSHPEVILDNIMQDSFLVKSRQKYQLGQKARDLIKKTTLEGKQVMIFINRRGYSRSLKCRDCLYEFKCNNCDNLMSYHKNSLLVKCHYCNYTIKASSCTSCLSSNLDGYGGVGVEKLTDEVRDLLNDFDTRLIIFSSDEVKNKNSISSIVETIKNKEVDVIIGTQIMTKGHHFPNIKAVIILDIDSCGSDGDFRNFERLFNMLTQLAGRAGREENGAKVLIQTSNPQNLILQSIVNQKEAVFYNLEITQRKKANLPPFSIIVAIIISCEKLDIAQKFSFEIGKKLNEYFIYNNLKNIKVFGPEKSFIHFLKRKYRYRLLIKGLNTQITLKYITSFADTLKIPKSIQFKIDVNPYSFF
jgi:primosomal protein N' (replication factor Y)